MKKNIIIGSSMITVILMAIVILFIIGIHGNKNDSEVLEYGDPQVFSKFADEFGSFDDIGREIIVIDINGIIQDADDVNGAIKEYRESDDTEEWVEPDAVG